MRIAQAAALTGLTARQIRYYQERGVLPEAERSPGRHRAFTDRDLQRLMVLKALLAADIPPAVAARAVAGQLPARERAEVDDRLDRQAAAQGQARAWLSRGVPHAADQPDISLMFDIYVLRTRMGAVLTDALSESGVVSGEYALLSLLVVSGPMTAGAMARQLGSAPTTLGRQLAELVGRGSVTRSADPGDRRRILFALTPVGERRYRQALPLAARLAVELDRSLRDRGTDPETARAVLQTVSATLRSLAPTP